jgi:hypothetical protein
MHSHLSLPISREQISAISIVSGVLLFVIRGGTYIVRGCLRKTEALPKLSIDQQPATAIATAADGDTGTKRLDLVEINRGRLIGNLERLVLTLGGGGELCSVGLSRRRKRPNSVRGTPGTGICGILPGRLLMQCLGGPVCRPGDKVHASTVMARASVAADGILNLQHPGFFDERSTAQASLPDIGIG